MKALSGSLPTLPVEIPMGPMVDMGFLLLVFFLVHSQQVPPERDISMGLPGTVLQSQRLEIPDEMQIKISADGRVFLNGWNTDPPNLREMPLLRATLLRLSAACQVNHSLPLVTLDVEDAATHQRIVDVLNACAQAHILSVTFLPPRSLESFL